MPDGVVAVGGSVGGRGGEDWYVVLFFTCSNIDDFGEEDKICYS